MPCYCNISYLFRASYQSILPIGDIPIPLFGSQVRKNNIFVHDIQFPLSLQVGRYGMSKAVDTEFLNQSTHL